MLKEGLYSFFRLISHYRSGATDRSIVYLWLASMSGRPPLTMQMIKPDLESFPSVPSEGIHRFDIVGGLPQPENRRFFPALDGIRAVAVLMVFWQHYTSGTSLAAYFRWGWTGVDVFFVLSGFLITGILYDTRDVPRRFHNFYIRRALRIFPLFYGVLLCALLLQPIFHWVWHPVWALWPVYLGNFGRFLWLKDYLANPIPMDHLLSTRPMTPPFILFFGHFWSLCIEEQFYLFWPLMVFYVRNRARLRNICLAAVIICPVARLICQNLLPSALLSVGFLERFTPLRSDSLLVGGLLALMLRGPESRQLQRAGRFMLPAVLGVFVLLQVASFSLTRHALDSALPGNLIFTVGYTVIDLLAAALILHALEPGTATYRLFNNRWLRRLGQMSYGFYIFHDILHVAYVDAALEVLPNRRYLFPLVMIFALLGTLLLSYLSFRFFEAPFLRLKSRWAA